MGAIERVLRIRADIFNEGRWSDRLDIFDPRCHLWLYSSPVESDQWQQINSAYFSPCDADLKSRVRFVTEQVAYVFMQWGYTVTVNGGQRWTFWDVVEHLPEKAYRSPTLIEDVSIKPDGTGTMTLNPADTVQHVLLTLHTKDFGQQWTTQ